MSNHVEPQTKTVVISWVEESRHQTVVRVPLDFDADERDLADGLAELSSDGFPRAATQPDRGGRRRRGGPGGGVLRPAPLRRSGQLMRLMSGRSAMSNARAKK